MNVFRWYMVRLNGGKTAVRATSLDEALRLYAAHSGFLSIIPFTTVEEITDEEAEKCWCKIR